MGWDQSAPIPRLAAAAASIGSAGTFDGVFLGGIIVVRRAR